MEKLFVFKFDKRLDKEKRRKLRLLFRMVEQFVILGVDDITALRQVADLVDGVKK